MNLTPNATSIFTNTPPISQPAEASVQKGVWILFFLLLPFFSLAQAKKYTLDGIAKIKNGIAYPYHVEFTANGNKLSGFSLTKQPDSSEFRTDITGRINRKKQTLTITELKPPLIQMPSPTDIRLFDGTLSYKLVGQKFIVTGTFVTRDIDNKIWEEGTMELEQLNTPASIFYQKKEEKHPEHSQTDQLVSDKFIPGATITDGVEKQIDWHTDTCVIEVWEGGISDGDRISILYNDAPALTNYVLTKTHKQLRLPITKKTGTSTIAIIAEKESMNTPNETNLLLLDGRIYYKIKAYNNTGKKAVIVLTKR